MNKFCYIEKKKIYEKKNFLFIEKYTPFKLKDFIINYPIARKLNNLLLNEEDDKKILSEQNNNIYNIQLYGPESSGKYTLAKFFVKIYYNDNCYLNEEEIHIDNKDIIYYKSNFHSEIIFDRYNFNSYLFMKKFFSKLFFNSKIQKLCQYKYVFILKNIHFLKSDILKILKYYIENSDFVFIIISRKPINYLNGFFYNIRVPTPNKKSILVYLKKIKSEEKLKITNKKLESLIDKRNLTDIINFLEILKIYGNNLEKKSKKIEIEEFNNNSRIKNISKLVIEPSINNLINIRDSLSDLLLENYCSTKILTKLFYFVQEEIKIHDIDDKNSNYFIELISIISDGEHRLKKGLRELHHLEYVIVRIMNLNKKFLNLV